MIFMWDLGEGGEGKRRKGGGPGGKTKKRRRGGDQGEVPHGSPKATKKIFNGSRVWLGVRVTSDSHSVQDEEAY